MVIFAAGAMLVVFSPSFAALLVGRALQGLGASGILPVASALIGDLYPVGKRGRMLGLIGAVMGIAFIIGPAISILLIPYGWQWLFAISVPVAIFVWAMGLRSLPSRQQETATRLDGAGVLTLVATLACITIGINRLDTRQLAESLLSTGVWPFLAGGLVFLAVFIWIERHTPEPFVRLELFASRQVRIACLVSIGAGMTEAAFVFLPSYAVALFDVTDRESTQMLMPLILALAIGSPITGRLLDRVGARWIVVAGTFMVVSGFLILGAMAANRLLYYAGLACIGLGLAALLGSALSYILLNEAEATERTVAQGMVRLFKGFGRLMGGALIGAVVASAALEQEGYGAAFLAIAVVTGLLHLLSYGLRSRGEELASLRGA
jgi:MFS family permease